MGVVSCPVGDAQMFSRTVDIIISSWICPSWNHFIIFPRFRHCSVRSVFNARHKSRLSKALDGLNIHGFVTVSIKSCDKTQGFLITMMVATNEKVNSWKNLIQPRNKDNDKYIYLSYKYNNHFYNIFPIPVFGPLWESHGSQSTVAAGAAR